MADQPEQPSDQRLSRRKLLGLAGAAGGAAVIGAGGYVALRGDDEAAAGSQRTEPFYGDHQAGIATESPKYLHFAAFDLDAGDRTGLQRLLRDLTAAADEATAGTSQGIDDPGRLTVTFGLGPSLFDDRYGLAMQRPDPLADIPPFRHDRLDPAISNGDLAVQFCSEDRAVTLHAAAAIATAARGAAHIRWSQDGFIRDRLRGDTSRNRRNLFGFLDGSNNLHGDDAAKMRTNVWADQASPAWMQNGTYMVTRKILMQIGEFLPESVDLQQDTFGRNKGTGAPLGEQHENDPVDPSKVLPDCHIMMANQRRSYSDKERILRRSYNYTDGYDAQLSNPEGGLFFIAFQQDPRRQFIRIQTRMSHGDRLTKYIVHRSSAIWAVPPGARRRGYVGETLFGSSAY
jgi:deferrochelatase/peroxidase EfeB